MTFYITPHRHMHSLRQAMNSLIEESMAETTPAEREMRLAVDVVARDDDYLVTALVPGLETEQINIEILNNTLTLRGEFHPVEKNGHKYLACELPEGKFSRVITLPTTLQASKVEANIKNGVLSIRLPKAEADRPRAIKVKTV